MERNRAFNSFKFFWILCTISVYYYGMLIYDVYVNVSEISKIHYYILPLLFIGIIVVGRNLLSNKLGYFLILFIGLNFIFFMPYYSPIDEGAHFDYILHILHEGKLPTLFETINSERLSSITGSSIPSGMQYEAVHPPLYYLSAALISFFFKSNQLISFIVLRLYGLSMIIVSYYFTTKTYQNLVNNRILLKNESLYFIVSMSFFLNPGIMARMVTLSNEHLLVPLLSVIIYLITRYINETEISLKKVLLLALVTGCLILTKITSVYVIGVVILFLLYKCSIKRTIIYIITSLSMVLPWIIFNIVNYKSVTGTELHVNFVKQIVNPTDVQFDLSFVFTRITSLFSTFWNPQESILLFTDPYSFVTSILNTSIFFIIVFALLYTIFRVKRFKDYRYITMSLLTISVFLNILVLIYGTLSESVDVMLGRYLYMNVASLIMLSLFVLQSLIKIKHVNNISRLLLILVMFILVGFLLNSMEAKDSLISNFVKSRFEVSLKNFDELTKFGYFESKDIQHIPIELGKQINENNQLMGAENDGIVINEDSFNSIQKLDSITYRITGNDPFISWKLSDNYLISLGDFIAIKVASINDVDGVEIKGQLFWDNGIGYSEENSYVFDIDSNKTILIPIGAHNSFEIGSNINGLRFDLDNMNLDSSIVIESISIERLIKKFNLRRIAS